MLRQSHSTKRTKVLHSGQVFKSVVDFSMDILLTERQVIKWLLHEDSFLQLLAARIVANELKRDACGVIFTVSIFEQSLSNCRI